MPTSALALIQLQLTLECIGLDQRGRLVRIPGPDPDDIARLLVARHVEGYTVYLRYDVDDAVAALLLHMPPERLFSDAAAVLAALAAGSDDAPAAPAWAGSTYHFARRPDSGSFADVVRDGEAFVVRVEGQAAAWAWSSRQSALAAELAVETAEPFRRRGYARQAARAWADEQLRQGRVAFYSHRADNQPSRELARSLGVTHVMDVVTY